MDSMSIVTRTGDKGETGLYGGQRVPKDDLRIDTIGTVDELNALLSLPSDEIDLPLALVMQIGRIQNVLFTLGADLATPAENNNAVVPRIGNTHIDELEEWISVLEENPLPPYFVLPGGSRAASFLHTARAVCRRAERLAVSLSHRVDIGPHILKYLNRLSDFLFLAALEANRGAGLENIRVSYS
jgi:cob(I)alamin adenosyltransferase